MPRRQWRFDVKVDINSNVNHLQAMRCLSKAPLVLWIWTIISSWSELYHGGLSAPDPIFQESMRESPLSSLGLLITRQKQSPTHNAININLLTPMMQIPKESMT